MNNIWQILNREGVKYILFSPLAQGLLINKYLKDVPSDSRVARKLRNGAMNEDAIIPEVINKAQQLGKIGGELWARPYTNGARMDLKGKRITSVLVDA